MPIHTQLRSTGFTKVSMAIGLIAGAVLLGGCSSSPAEQKVLAAYSAAVKHCDSAVGDSQKVCLAAAEMDKDCALAEARHQSNAAQLAMAAGFPNAQIGPKSVIVASNKNTIIASAN